MTGSRAPSFAQVEVHPAVRNTPYWFVIATNPSLILNALALSIELGCLIYITTQCAINNYPQYANDVIVYKKVDYKGHDSIIYTTPCVGKYLSIFQLKLPLLIIPFRPPKI